MVPLLQHNNFLQQKFEVTPLSVYLKSSPKQKLGFRKTICSTWFSLEKQPFEFLSVKSANARMLLKNLMANN